MWHKAERKGRIITVYSKYMFVLPLRLFQAGLLWTLMILGPQPYILKPILGS